MFASEIFLAVGLIAVWYYFCMRALFEFIRDLIRGNYKKKKPDNKNNRPSKQNTINSCHYETAEEEERRINYWGSDDDWTFDR